MKQFIGTLFLARDIAHSAHLNTQSYAKHMALGSFYDGVIDLADSLAEAYQGRHGLIGPIVRQQAKKASDIIAFLEASLKEIEASRYTCVPRTDSTLQNIVDEIISLYLSTIYKLKFLD